MISGQAPAWKEYVKSTWSEAHPNAPLLDDKQFQAPAPPKARARRRAPAAAAGVWGQRQLCVEPARGCARLAAAHASPADAPVLHPPHPPCRTASPPSCASEAPAVRR